VGSPNVVQYQAVASALTTIAPVSSGNLMTGNGGNVLLLQSSTPQYILMSGGTAGVSSGLQSSGQPSLTQGQILLQQAVLQQLESSGWLAQLREKLRTELVNLQARNNNVLPSRTVIVDFLIGIAEDFLRGTPFGPIFELLKPVIVPIIDGLITERQSITPPAPAPTPGTGQKYEVVLQEIPGSTPGAPKRYTLILQPVNGGTVPNILPNGHEPSRSIGKDTESPLEKPTVPPGP